MWNPLTTGNLTDPDVLEHLFITDRCLPTISLIAQTSTKSIPDYYEAQYSFDVDGQQYLNDSISTMPAPTAFAVAEAPIVAVVLIVQRVS